MLSNWQRYLRDHPRAIDAVVALVLFAASGPGTMLTTPGMDERRPWLPGTLLAAVSCTALLWHRSRPRAVALVAIVCTMGIAMQGYILTVLLLGPLMAALYSVAVRSGQKTARIFCIAAIIPVVDTALIAGPAGETIVLKTVGPIAWLALPVALGSVTRLRRSYLEAVQARAEFAERTREEEARHRVAEERMRIARELHDVVAHHLALANAQAGTVAHLIRTHPAQAEKLVNELTSTTSSALREMKATVGLLRQVGDPDTSLEPVPRLAQLPDLAASFATVGLTVTITTEGQQPLSPGVDLTAYRIVQEALTNITKHAATGSAEVRLTYSPDRLDITVTDDGSGVAPAAAGPGYGIIGMRERAQAVGGRLRAGRRPEGGFEVAASLPLQADSIEEDHTT